MSTRNRLAFILYCIAFGSYAAMGLAYLLYQQVMPYHLAVIGTGWELIDPRMRAMLLVFLHAVGAAELSLSCAGLVIAAIPFRRGEAWARWALPAVFAPNGIFLSCATFYLYRTYGAPTPWPVTWALLIVCAAAFVISAMKDR